MFESSTQAILSSIASCMSSRLEHDRYQAIGVQVTLNDYARHGGILDSEVSKLVRQRLVDAGIRCSGEDGERGCALSLDIQLEADGLCCFDLQFYRAGGGGGGRSGRPGRGGAWRLMHMAHAETSQAVTANLLLMVAEFVRQYMEAN